MKPAEGAPSVFVILLNWNGWQDTVKCIDSLKSLTYPNYEIVVLDNSSTDDSVARIREAHPDVTLIETGANLGFAGGNNVGIRYALDKGADYVWLLNNDTMPKANALTSMVNVIESDPDIGAVGSVLYHMHDPSQVQVWGGLRVSFLTGTVRPFRKPVHFEQIHYLSGASILLRRETLEEVRLDESYFMYWEDVDFGFRLRQAGWKLAVAEQSHILHKESSSLGKHSVQKDILFNTYAIFFFLRYAFFPLWPIVMGIGGRLLKRLVQGDWRRAQAVWQGAKQGWIEMHKSRALR